MSTRRERLREAVGDLTEGLDREEYVDLIEATIDSRAGHNNGWWAEHKHPLDRAAELEEEWRFAQNKGGLARRTL